MLNCKLLPTLLLRIRSHSQTTILIRGPDTVRLTHEQWALVPFQPVELFTQASCILSQEPGFTSPLCNQKACLLKALAVNSVPKHSLCVAMHSTASPSTSKRRVYVTHKPLSVTCPVISQPRNSSMGILDGRGKVTKVVCYTVTS